MLGSLSPNTWKASSRAAEEAERHGTMRGSGRDPGISSDIMYTIRRDKREGCYSTGHETEGKGEDRGFI